jgi:hypothetical protein
LSGMKMSTKFVGCRKTMLKIVLKVYLRKWEGFKIHDLNLHSRCPKSTLKQK